MKPQRGKGSREGSASRSDRWGGGLGFETVNIFLETRHRSKTWFQSRAPGHPHPPLHPGTAEGGGWGAPWGEQPSSARREYSFRARTAGPPPPDSPLIGCGREGAGRRGGGGASSPISPPLWLAMGPGHRSGRGRGRRPTVGTSGERKGGAAHGALQPRGEWTQVGWGKGFASCRNGAENEMIPHFVHRARPAIWGRRPDCVGWLGDPTNRTFLKALAAMTRGTL